MGNGRAPSTKAHVHVSPDHPDHTCLSAALYTALEQGGALEGTAVVQLRGRPRDAHNENPAQFSPEEWAEALRWMRGALGLTDNRTRLEGQWALKL